MTKSINMRARTLLALTVATVAAALPSAAWADFGLQPGSFQANVLDSSSAVVPSPQAGAHPYAQQIKLQFNTKPANPQPDPDGEARTIITKLPPGFVGNPQATPRCEQRDFPPPTFGGYSRCAPAAQVGVVTTDLGLISGSPFPPGIYTMPVYNLVPPKGVVARLGFVVLVPITIDISVRTGGDYGITATLNNISDAINIYGTTLTLWGVPADPSHDAQRYRPGQFSPGDGNGNGLPSNLPLTPFLTNPAQCDVPLTTEISLASWADPSKFLSYLSNPTPYIGCERLSVNASMIVSPTSTEAGEPTGLGIDLNVDQPQTPNALATPPLRKVTVTLPEGVTVSPSSADGLGECTLDEIGLNNDRDPTCPDSSKVGSVEVDTPLLDEPLLGSVYLAKPGQGNNPFNSLVALYIVAKGSGVLVKLPGSVSLHPRTGRVSSTFDNTPQLPFSRLHVALDSGPRAPLAQSNVCGTKTTSATLSSWAGQTVNLNGTYSVGAGAGSPTCGPRGFAPQVAAGSLGSEANGRKPFSFRLTRSDSDQTLSRLTTTLPEGLLADVKNVPLCPEAQAAAGTCGASSLIGHVTVGSGPGPTPYYVDNGRAYLTGGYDGAPFGLSIVVRAIAGPFDLGDVVVRGALSIDSKTTRVRVTTDPFPTILQGIPLQLRDVRLVVDRPGFMMNPTNCSPKSIDANVVSTESATYATSVPYQVVNCAALPFAPKLSLSLTGKGQTKDGAHPGIVAHLTQTDAESRLDKVSVTLPLSLALDPDNAQALCKPLQALAKACPPTSVVGRATAVSVLHQPLTGPVYFVEGLRTDPKSGRQIKTLPKLFIRLKGEGVEIDLNASSEVDPLDRLVTTFEDLPDAPVRSVDLTIDGGKHGVIVVSDADVCAATQTATARIDGQSGAIVDKRVVMATPCSPSVLSFSVTRSSLRVKLGGLGAGKVTLSGPGIRSTSRTLRSATVATMVAKRTRGAAPTRVKVKFDPAGAAKAKTYMLPLKKSSTRNATRKTKR